MKIYSVVSLMSKQVMKKMNNDYVSSELLEDDLVAFDTFLTADLSEVTRRMIQCWRDITLEQLERSLEDEQSGAGLNNDE